MLQQVNVKFDSAEQIRQFVNTINKLDSDFDLGSGRRVVDAKSILGVMALDFSGPLRLRYQATDESIEEKIAPFIYQGV